MPEPTAPTETTGKGKAKITSAEETSAPLPNQTAASSTTSTRPRKPTTTPEKRAAKTSTTKNTSPHVPLESPASGLSLGDSVFSHDGSPGATPDTSKSIHAISDKIDTKQRPSLVRHDADDSVPQKSVDTDSKEVSDEDKSSGGDDAEVKIEDDSDSSTGTDLTCKPGPGPTRDTIKEETPSPTSKADMDLLRGHARFIVPPPRESAREKNINDSTTAISFGSPWKLRGTRAQTVPSKGPSSIDPGGPTLPPPISGEAGNPIAETTHGCKICSLYATLDIAASALTTPGIGCERLNKMIPYNVEASLKQSEKSDKLVNKCVAFVIKKKAGTAERCTKMVSPSREISFVREQLRALQATVQHKDGNMISMIKQLEGIFQLLFCGMHGLSANNNLEGITQHLERLQDRAVYMGNTDQLALEQIKWWVDCILGPGGSNNAHKRAPRLAQLVTQVMQQQKVVDRWFTMVARNKRDSENEYFVPFHSLTASVIPTKSELLTVVRGPLNARDRETGCIYLFEVCNGKDEPTGYVKIGFSTEGEQTRFDEYSRCVVPLKLKKVELSSKENDEGCLPHASRVETLVHTELKQTRRKTGCRRLTGKHGNYHNEFFRIETERAKEVCNRWIEWMVGNKPYKPFDTEKKFLGLDHEKINEGFFKAFDDIPLLEVTQNMKRAGTFLKGFMK